VRAALAPRQHRDEWGERVRAPITDYVAVRYEFLRSPEYGDAGLCRTTWAVPVFEWALEEEPQSTPISSELISQAVTELRFEYYDGQEWFSYWETTEDSRRLPQAVAIRLTVIDARENEHAYRTIVSIPAA
jgi:hypothetical protein